MSGVVYIPWYATVMRHDALTEAINELAPVALRYGATKYAVHRSRDDRYKITQMAWFESKSDWYSFWDGPEMIEFRSANSGRFQIPIVYVWHDELTVGEIATAEEVESTASTP
jgi:hypothetical protein